MNDHVFAEFGPFFATDTHAAAAPVDGPWSTLAAALANPRRIDSRVERVRTALAAGAASNVSPRVAASVTHLGLVARLLAPALAAAVTGTRMSLDPADVWWQDHLGGPFPLSVVTVDAEPALDDGFPRAVDDLTALFDASYPVGPHVLGGNIASAINSAVRMIGTARPELADAARRHADLFLARPDIEGGYLRAGPNFRRRSCCLIYQVSGDRTAVCGDCVLSG